jgi:hypothetical protein
MPNAASGGEIAGIISAIVVGIVAIGKGIQWLASFAGTRADSRSSKLQKWHDELAARESDLDAVLEARFAKLEQRSETHADQNQALRMAFELVASALRAIDPKNTALSRAEQLLQKAFPLMPIVPPDMSTALQAIENKGLAASAAGRRTEVL